VLKMLDTKCRVVVQMGCQESVHGSSLFHNSPRVSPARVASPDKEANDDARKPDGSNVSRRSGRHLVRTWSTDGRPDIDSRHTSNLRGTPQVGAPQCGGVCGECYRKGVAEHSPENVRGTGAAGGLDNATRNPRSTAHSRLVGPHRGAVPLCKSAGRGELLPH